MSTSQRNLTPSLQSTVLGVLGVVLTLSLIALFAVLGVVAAKAMYTS